ncbi:MAG: NosD domain-containing protein, partial [Promethearchaeota archaeon]
IITENFIDGLGSQYDGIAFTNFGDYNTVTDNNLQNLKGIAIEFGDFGSSDILNFNHIQGNTITGGYKGIYFDTDGTGNIIIENSFLDLTSNALVMEGETPEIMLQTTLVQDNEFFACKTSIVVGRYTEDTLITGNHINGTSTGTGINLYTWSRNNIVKENIINNNKLGIWLQNSNETHPIINNTINCNAEYGIYGYACKDQSILDNTIRYNNLSGIHFFYSENNVVAGNIISESIQDGLSLFQSNETYISGNIVTMNQNNGIFANESNVNHIVGNMIYDNGGTGISLESSNDSVVHDNILGGNLVCMEEVNCIGTIDYDNLCIQIGDGDPNDNKTLSMSSLLDALTDTEGILIGGTGLGIGLIIAALVAGGKKKPKKK